MRHAFKWLNGFAAVAAMMSFSVSASACSACFGKSDSALAAGMNWGIFTLMGVIVSVLGGVAGFFVYLARKSAAASLTAANRVETDQAREQERELIGALD